MRSRREYRLATAILAFALLTSAAQAWRATALHLLLSNSSSTEPRNAKSVQTLLALGAEVNARDNSGATPLKTLLPCRNPDLGEEDLRIIDVLAQSGADLNLPDHAGETPLLCAVRTSHFTATARLIALGAELNPVLQGGKGYLHWAVRVGHGKAEAEHIVQALIVAGADFDTADDRGRTPLHEAAASGNAVAVRILLHHGADIGRRDGAGRLPVELLPCAQQGSCSALHDELVASLSRRQPTPRWIAVGEVVGQSEGPIEISGALRVGERLFLRTQRGDFSVVTGRRHGRFYQAQLSPAAARFAVPKARLFRRQAIPASARFP